MKISKDNIIDKELFNTLREVDPDVVKKMLYNMISMNAEDEDERANTDEINAWVRNNCNGLVYFDDIGISYHGTHLAYRFEQEEDMVAFKLRWA